MFGKLMLEENKFKKNIFVKTVRKKLGKFEKKHDRIMYVRKKLW